MDEETLDDATYEVVRNHEDQYSIWPADDEPPAGWERAGFAGRKADCLEHIERVWLDMRPLSLRKAMAADGGSPQDGA